MNEKIKILFQDGVAKNLQGLYKEAIKCYLEILEIEANHIATMCQISYSLCSIGKRVEALKYAEKVNDLDPDWYTLMSSSAIKKSMGNLIGAEEDRNKAWDMGKDFC